MKDSKQFPKRFSLPILLFVSLVLILISNISIGKVIRNSFSYIYTPIAFGADNVGNGINDYWFAFRNIKDLKNENEDLKDEIVKLKSLQSNQILSDEESKQLKALIKSANLNADTKYFKAQVMSYTGLSEMILNRGEKDGIKVGSYVTSNNLFIGLVNDVDRYSSMMVSIYGKTSSIKVMVLSKKEGAQKINDVLKKNKFVNAVMIGGGDTVMLENIPINKGVSNGDLVVTNDERISQYIIVGEVQNLTTDMAVSTLNASVKPYEDFTQLNFVLISNND